MELTRGLVDKTKRLLRIVLLSLAIGAILGYLAFHMMMPSVAIPETTNPSLAVVAVILLAVGILIGMLSTDLESMAIQMLMGIIIGVFVSWLLFISPSTNPDIIIPGASGYIFNVLHAALPVILLGLVMLFVGGFIGTTIMEGVAARANPSPFELEATKRSEGQHKS